MSGPKDRYLLVLNFLPKRERPLLRAFSVESLPAIVSTIADAVLLCRWASVVSHLGGRGRWIPGLKSSTSDWTVVKVVVVGMP